MECREISFIACARTALRRTSWCSKEIILFIACSISIFFEWTWAIKDWVTLWTSQAWRVVNVMPRNLIYCMCWYFTWQHFMVLKIHYLTHRLINVNIFDEQRTRDDWVTISTSHLWRAVNGMPRNRIYCMCWYCTWQHFMVLKIHYLTHRLLNVIIFRVEIRLSYILN